MKVIFSIGRFNPPTIGHDVLFDQILSLCEVNVAIPMIFIVDGEITGKDKSRNPLSGEYRKHLLNNMGFRVDLVKNAYEALEVIDIVGLSPTCLVCGSDRQKQYQSMISSYGFKCDVFGIDRNILPVSATDARNATDMEFEKLISRRLDKNTVEDLRQRMKVSNGKFSSKQHPENTG